MQPVGPQDRRILLASGSPRRLELTRRIGFEPVVRVSDIPEAPHPGEGPAEYARRLATEKAAAVARETAGEDLPGWILAADTIVVHDGAILEKPADDEDAVGMLSRLQGSVHEVVTAFCWRWRVDGPRLTRSVRADVEMRPLPEAVIRRYVASGEPMDKAGSYGIQDIGSVLVRRIEGSYFCVVGLPVCEVVETLEELGGLTEYPFAEIRR